MHESSSPITLKRLNGTNYVEWSLNAHNKIRGRKCWGFISCTKAVPKDNKSEEYKAWEYENCLVKSWLIDAITKDIISLFLQLATAKEIWEVVKQTYSVDQDASKVYQLHYEELDDIDDCNMKFANDIVKYTTEVNSQRVYSFLASLDPQLDGVRGCVLATKPLPNIHVVYAMVCAEANSQDIMLGGKI
ncbi:hypothetical protein Q3G72_005529 [Acer saccharum]|nr:hypothetical protein Q3G72_005529 [Acer saccharum]